MCTHAVYATRTALQHTHHTCVGHTSVAATHCGHSHYDACNTVRRIVLRALPAADRRAYKVARNRCENKRRKRITTVATIITVIINDFRHCNPIKCAIQQHISLRLSVSLFCAVFLFVVASVWVILFSQLAYLFFLFDDYWLCGRCRALVGVYVY